MRDLLKKACAIAGLVLGLVALLSAVASGFSAPHWVLPAAVVALAGAVALVVFP